MTCCFNERTEVMYLREVLLFFLSGFILLEANGYVLDNTLKAHKTNLCNVPDKIVQEIQNYSPIVKKIIETTIEGKFKGRTWRTLAHFVDKFGSRIAGSKNLENAIDYMLHQSKRAGLENVHGEAVTVPHWVRGKESATLLSPRVQKLPMLGLGSSIATPHEGIRADVLVVNSFADLHRKAHLVPGKIVVYNEVYVSYEETVLYRFRGASEAARFGAVAALIRTVTPFSIASPHTGWQSYEQNVTHIPVACITIEDAEMLQRMSLRGERIVIHLKMDAQNLKPAISRNTVAELVGYSNPKKVVVVSGHLDSWDVGQGAMDDGGGAFISWNSVVILSKLGLRPRRTIRAILWTAEEEGLIGSQAYVKRHRNETNNLDFAMESDEGTFTPLGLSFSGSRDAGCILKEILKLLRPLNATRFGTPEDGGPDITLWTHMGVPGASLINANEKYFWFHHSAGDMMTVQDSHILDLCTAVWAATAYVIADMKVDIPR